MNSTMWLCEHNKQKDIHQETTIGNGFLEYACVLTDACHSYSVHDMNLH